MSTGVHVDDALFERLTERQRQLLRLVNGHYSSKQAADAMGLSHNTVDHYAKEVISLLGVGSRRDAARAFADYERRQQLAPQPLALDAAPPSTALHPEQDARGESEPAHQQPDPGTSHMDLGSAGGGARLDGGGPTLLPFCQRPGRHHQDPGALHPARRGPPLGGDDIRGRSGPFLQLGGVDHDLAPVVSLLATLAIAAVIAIVGSVVFLALEHMLGSLEGMTNRIYAPPH